MKYSPPPTLSSVSPTGGGEERCRALARRCGELEAELRAKREENAELLRELEQKSALVAVLENSVKEREKKYLEELKTKSHKMAALSGELEQRAGTIAYLTSQLHATKKKLLAGGSSDASPDVSPVGSYKPAPPPPPPPTTTKKKDRQPETPRRRMKKSLSQPLHPERTEVYRLGPDGKRVILRETTTSGGGGGGDMPDPTPFLQARRESPEPQVVRERPAVIPPIVASERSPVPPALDAPRDRRGLGAHVGVAHRIPHAATTVPPATPTPSRPLQAEVETVAVDQVGEEKVVRERAGPHRTV